MTRDARQRARTTAWSAPGATSADNDITVDFLTTIPAGLSLRPVDGCGAPALRRGAAAYARQVRDSATLLGIPSM